MANHPLPQDATSQLNRITEELNAIDSVIVANLEILPEQTELISRLVRRCDDISLELDALRMEVEIPKDGSSAGEKKSPGSSADRSGLKP